MKKLFFPIAILFVIVTALTLIFNTESSADRFRQESLANSLPWGNASVLAMRRRVGAMSTEEKIGQMMMVSIPGVTLLPATADWLRTHHIGGVILMGGNVRSAEQVKSLSAALQERARGPEDPPLFVGADQEGGGVVQFPFLQEDTAQKNILLPTAAFSAGVARAKELRDLGVNVNFSPVLDVAFSSADFVSGRAFRGDADAARILGSAMIRGYSEGGVISAAKYFPGYGGTAIDPHKNLPIISRNPVQMERALLPFREAIKATVPMIMTGHVKIPEMDSEYPASMSPRAINLLRHDMGYRGVVVSDDLGMNAITKYYQLSDAAVQSIKAGVDIILAVRSIADYTRVYEAVRDAAGRGEIAEERINQSVSRILSLKEKFLKQEN